MERKQSIHRTIGPDAPRNLKPNASNIHGLAETGEKKSPVNRAAWREKLNSLKLRTLSAERIENWRIDFIRRKGTEPVKEKSARVSANSSIGCARALFGVDVAARVRDSVELPSALPFHGLKVEKVRVPRYRSGFGMGALLENAKRELAISKPEQYKIFLLAAMAGLRRNEIDKLPWTAFRFEKGIIRNRGNRILPPEIA